MKALWNFAIFAIAAGSLACAAAAGDSAPAVPSGALGATFDYSIAVQTPKGKKSSTGRIKIAPSGSNGLTLTVASSDGTTKTIPLKMANGSVAMPSPAASSVPAAAQTLMANMKLAATVGVAAKKSGGESFTVPVLLTPVGSGAAVSAQLAMKSAAAQGETEYSGTVGGSTSTKLPSSGGGIDPEEIAKDAGVGMVARGFTPAGRIATAVAMHHRTQQQQQAEKGELADDVSLTVTTTFADGRFREIHGAQTDSLKVANRTVKIYSTWSFTRVQQ